MKKHINDKIQARLSGSQPTPVSKESKSGPTVTSTEPIDADVFLASMLRGKMTAVRIPLKAISHSGRKPITVPGGNR